MSNSASLLALSHEYYDRSAECRRVAEYLEGAPLFDLPGYAGDDTWQGPVADEFLTYVNGAITDVIEAIEALVSNAVGLANDGDNLARQAAAAAMAEQEARDRAAREAHEQAERERRESSAGAGGVATPASA